MIGNRRKTLVTTIQVFVEKRRDKKIKGV